MGAAGGVGAADAGSWLQPVVGPCLRVVLQSLVLEKVESVRQMLLQAWRALLQHSRAADVAAGLSVRDMRAMLNLLCTPCGQTLDTAVLVVPLQRRLVPWSSQEAEIAGLATRPAKRAKTDAAAARSVNGMGSASQGSAGDSASVAGCAVDPEGWPGMSDQQAAVHTRLLASRAVAELCDKLTGQVRVCWQLVPCAQTYKPCACLGMTYMISIGACTPCHPDPCYSPECALMVPLRSTIRGFITGINSSVNLIATDVTWSI
jgi:hypothetical protein